MTVLLVVTAQSAITHHNKGSMGYYDYSDDYYSYKPFTVNVIAGEWLPLTVEDHERLVDQSEELVFDDGTRGDFERKGGKDLCGDLRRPGPSMRSSAGPCSASSSRSWRAGSP